MFKAIGDLFRRKNSPPADCSELLKRIQIGQQLQISGSGPLHVAGRVVYELEGFTWNNFRLLDTKGNESWLSVEDWGDQDLEAVHYRTVEVYPMPSAPEEELIVAVKEPGSYQPHSSKVAYRLVDHGFARVAFIENDDHYLRKHHVEPISVSAGDQFTYFQYANPRKVDEILSFEIWGGEIYPSHGQHLVSTSVQRVG